MNRLISICLILILAVPNGRAQDSNALKSDGTPAPVAIPATTESLPPSSKAIVLVIDASSQQSVVVKHVDEALEKAGIATSKSAETAPPADSSISVTLSMVKLESFETIRLLIEALRDAGVQQISLQEGGFRYEGKEQNVLFVHDQPGYSPAEFQKIERAVMAVGDQCGLSLLVGTRGPLGGSSLDEPVTGIAPSDDDSAQDRIPARDDARNGRLEQKTIDQLSSSEGEVIDGRDIVAQAGMAVDEVKAEFTAAKEVPASEIKVFVLKHSEAKSTAELLEQLITTKPFRAIADKRVNSVVVAGSAKQLKAVEALLLKLDVALEDETAANAAKLFDLTEKLFRLRTDYETSNKHAHQLAESLRQTPDDAKNAELRTAVQRSFTLRQSLLRAEMLEMQTRLLQTQQSIDMRERISDQIVDRRVEDLLNPQLKWEQNRTSLNEHEGGTKNRIAASADAGPIDSSAPSGDSRVAVLARVQGTWDVEVHSNEDPDGKLSAGMDMVCEIRDNQLAYLTNGESQLSYTIRFGEPATPQPIDLVEDQDGQKFRPGIIEIADNLVRICLPNQVNDLKRPDTFAFGNATDIHVLRRPTPPAITELEGDWHLVEEIKDRQRKGVEVPENLTIRGDNYTIKRPLEEIEVFRIQVDPEHKSFVKLEKTEMTTEWEIVSTGTYSLQEDQFTLMEEFQPIRLWRRGHRRFPATVPPFSSEQIARWRSAVVDIFIDRTAPVDPSLPPEILVGRGVVVSADGLMLTAVMNGYYLDGKNVTAVFDDARRVRVTLVDDAGSGFYSLQLPAGTLINHHLNCADAAYAIGDEVRICGYEEGSGRLFQARATKLVLNDRRMPNLESHCWQLEPISSLNYLFCNPVLSAEGKLVAITKPGVGASNELLLASPASDFDELFPKAKVNVEPAQNSVSALSEIDPAVPPQDAK